MTNKHEPINMRGTMVSLKVGEKMILPFGSKTYASVRNCASTLGIDKGRKYVVNLDRNNSQFIITRTI